MNESLALLALNASRAFGERVAAALGRPLAAHEERLFEDGEHKTRPWRASVGGMSTSFSACMPRPSMASTNA